MNFNHTLSAVLRGKWLLERSWAEAHIPLVLSMLKGNPVSFVERSGNGQYEQPFCIDPATMQKYSLYKWDDYQSKYVPNPSIPPNSVAIIPISGPITKYNGECGEPGSIMRASQITELSKRDNISSLILLVDTPGGESRSAHAYTSAIRGCKKPIIALVDGMAASLGMWIISGCDEVYVSSKLDEVGSVGSYCTLLDFRGWFEKEGIKLHEIYAPQSTDKNKNYRDALEGNYDLIQADLKIHVDDFISYIKIERPASAAFESEWSSGKMFYAADAMRIGLIDGVLDFEKVISKAAWLGKRNKNS